MSDAAEAIENQRALIEAVMPALPAESPAARLGAIALKGLAQLERIIDLPLDEDDPKQMRLVGDMAMGVCKLYQRASESAFKAEQGSALVDLLKALNTAKEARGETPAPPAIENEG